MIMGFVDGFVSRSADRRVISVDVTTNRIVGGIVALQLAVLATIGIEFVGPDLPIVRPVVTFIYLTIIPGFLLYRLIGVQAPSSAEAVVYTVGLSLASLMFFGSAINFGLLTAGVAAPLSELPLVLSVSFIILGLTMLYQRNAESEPTLELELADVTSPAVLGLACLPLLGAYGGLILTRFSNNVLLLLLYAIIALVPALALLGVLPKRLFPFAIWAVALSLLLQNALTGHYMAWGDQPKEAALALNVLREGVWLPSQAPAYGAKYTMLRIVILNPIYTLFTGLKFVWVFKVLHPLLFALTPVVLYRAYNKYVDADVAFISTFLFMSLFSFFIVLSRNTRTATAIFFLALVALLIADDTLNAQHRKLLTLLFIVSIVVSHYGVSYIVLLALALVYPLTRLIRWVTGRETRNMTSISFVLLYVSATFAWYIFASPRSKAFNLLVGFAETFTDTLYSTFLTSPESTSASVRYVASNFNSTTLDAIKYYNVLIGALIGFGVLVTFWKFYQDKDDVAFGTEYLAYAAVFLGVFGITFLPIERFNTARTYPTTLLFFAPFFVIGVRELFGLANQFWSVDANTTKQVAAVIVIGYFLLNVGFISATMTNEYSTNALVEKDRIMDDGAPIEKSYFYKQYPTVYDVESTSWIHNVGVNNTTSYESGWPGIRRGAVGHTNLTRPPDDSPRIHKHLFTPEMVKSGDPVGPGYVYLSAYSVIGNTITLPGGHFEFNHVTTEEAAPLWQNKSRVYTNGGSTIYR